MWKKGDGVSRWIFIFSLLSALVVVMSLCYVFIMNLCALISLLFFKNSGEMCECFISSYQWSLHKPGLIAVVLKKWYHIVICVIISLLICEISGNDRYVYHFVHLCNWMPFTCAVPLLCGQCNTASDLMVGKGLWY